MDQCAVGIAVRALGRVTFSGLWWLAVPESHLQVSSSFKGFGLFCYTYLQGSTGILRCAATLTTLEILV